jgi:predicted HicB family RNase H-like nuclease
MSVQKRFQLVIPQWLKDKAKEKADSIGISLSEYIKDLIKKDIR